MSAFLAKTYADRIELLTDRAVYLEDGTLVDIREKVHRVQGLPVAITSRGDVRPLEFFGTYFDRMGSVFGTFDGCLEALPTVLDGFKRHGLAPCEVVIAGISESEGPIVLYVSSVSYVPNMEPFRLYRMPAEFGGGNSIEPHELAAAGITPESVADGFAERGADLMEIMRAKPGPNPVKPELPPLYGVGGGCDHTVIRADGVTTTRLRDWPDVIGEKIDPHADAVEVPAAA